MTQPRQMLVSVEKAEGQGWAILDDEGSKLRLCRRFEPLCPLSWEEGGELFERGMNSVEAYLDCEGQVLVDTVFLGEFTHCSGRAIGGKAPAWIFPSMPMDQVEEDEIPDSVLAVLKEAIASICRVESNGK